MSEKPEPEYRKLLLSFLGSITLCDHMGDVSNDVLDVCERIGLEFDPDWKGRDWGNLDKVLHEMGITTLNGTTLWGEDDDPRP